MRARLVVLIALLLLASVPSAAAGAFDLSQREFALDLPPGGMAVAEVPVRLNQDGFLYAKLLVTPGNAVNDGTRANGSVENATGWRVSFAARLANDTVTHLGTFVESTVSERVPVFLGDELRLIVTVHIPDDVENGGPRQKVYIAIGYRLEESMRPGSSSGASIEESRAVTLILTNDEIAPISSTPSPAHLPSEEAGTSTGTETIERAGTLVAQNSLPLWFMLSVIGLLVAGVLVVAGVGFILIRGRRAPTNSPGEQPGESHETAPRAEPAQHPRPADGARRLRIDGEETRAKAPERE